jgi:hypothetical protein
MKTRLIQNLYAPYGAMKRGCEEKVRKNSPGLHSLFFMSGSKSKTGKRE